MKSNPTAPARRIITVAILLCALLAALPAAHRYHLKYRANRFAMAFAATSRSDVPVTLPEQIVYSVFYSISQAEPSYSRR